MGLKECMAQSCAAKIFPGAMASESLFQVVQVTEGVFL